MTVPQEKVAAIFAPKRGDIRDHAAMQSCRYAERETEGTSEGRKRMACQSLDTAAQWFLANTSADATYLANIALLDAGFASLASKPSQFTNEFGPERGSVWMQAAAIYKEDVPLLYDGPVTAYRIRLFWHPDRGPEARLEIGAFHHKAGSVNPDGFGFYDVASFKAASSHDGTIECTSDTATCKFDNNSLAIIAFLGPKPAGI